MKRLAITLSAVFICTAVSFGQGATFLGYNPDARSLGVAGASATDNATAFSVWNNAAASAFSEDNFAAGASFGIHQPSFSNVKQASVAGYGVLSERWSISAGYRYNAYQPIDIADESGIYNGSFTPSGMNASVGAAFKILPSLAVGATAGFVYSNIGGPKAATAVSFDIGLLYRVGGFRAALTAANLGTSLNYGGAKSYSLPSRADLGLGYCIGKEHGRHTLDISAQGSVPLAGKDFRAAGGLRYTFNDMVNIAAGYNYGIGEGLPSYASIGAGVKFFGVALDFAYLLAQSGTPLSGTMVFNLSYAF